MMNKLENIKKLISNNNFEGALKELNDIIKLFAPRFVNEIIIHKSNFERIKSDERKQLISYEQLKRENTLLTNSLLELLDKIKEETNILSSVFISYNHGDSKIAERIKKGLIIAGIDVIIDKDAMKAGRDIKNFIEKSVFNTNITISLVSNKSLKSAWVAMETINTFFHEKLVSNKKFIACFIDEDFFQPEFTLKTIDEIDKQIKKNQELIPKYHEKMLDTRDLNNQNTRLLALRNNLDEIVRRLRESLCLNVNESDFDSSMKRLIEAIKE